MQPNERTAATLQRLAAILVWERTITAGLVDGIRTLVPSCGNPPIDPRP